MYVSARIPARVYYRYSADVTIRLVKMYDAIDEYDNGYWGMLTPHTHIGGRGSMRMIYKIGKSKVLVQVYPTDDGTYRTSWAQMIGATEHALELNPRYAEEVRIIMASLDEKVWTDNDIV